MATPVYRQRGRWMTMKRVNDLNSPIDLVEPVRYQASPSFRTRQEAAHM